MKKNNKTQNYFFSAFVLFRQRKNIGCRLLSLFIVLSVCISNLSAGEKAETKKYFTDGFLDSLQRRTFNFFWETTDAKTGLTPDRYPNITFSSTAAIGFALTSYGIGAERGYVTRAQAAQRVLSTLQFLLSVKQGNESEGTNGSRGFFYHFLKFSDGTRFADDVELSSIDTGLLMAGILFCQSYFDNQTPIEQSIRRAADSLYRRVEWNWMQPEPPLIAMGWYPEKGFHHLNWRGYDEAMILYLLALGSPTHPIAPEAWSEYTKSYLWEKYFGYEFVSFAPLFGHQYTACWVDLRGIRDAYMRKKEIDYFENSRLATYANRAYAVENPRKFRGYGQNLWGFSACDGPADETRTVDGMQRRFLAYGARGHSYHWTSDDGTITPTAAGGSIAFAPEICFSALKTMREEIPGLWSTYGFFDSFNLSYITEKTPNGWVDNDYLGIDQGPIVIMIENLRSEFVWKVMKKNPSLIRGLKRAGFTGGWLDK
ncbi:MAG: Tat pathway signal protein [Bacteroidetes bacterium]|nr:Tat pathway signal protein [Bacteroidota bacterium]